MTANPTCTGYRRLRGRNASNRIASTAPPSRISTGAVWLKLIAGAVIGSVGARSVAAAAAPVPQDAHQLPPTIGASMAGGGSV